MKLLRLQACIFVCFFFSALALVSDCPATVTKTHISTKKIAKDADQVTDGVTRSAAGSSIGDDDLDVDLFSTNGQSVHTNSGGQCPVQVATTKTVMVEQALWQNREGTLASEPDARVLRRADSPPPTAAASTTGAGVASSSVSTDYTRSCKPPCMFTPAPVPLKETTTLHFTNVTTAFCSVFHGATYKWPFYYTIGDVGVSSLGMAPVHVPETATSGQTLAARPTIAPPPSCSVQIPDGTFICPPPIAPISPNGKCGPKVDGPSYCPILECCSANGECGIDQQHCNYTLGCQNEYGLCYTRWDDAVRDQHSGEPEPAAPNEQKMINVPCPAVIGNDMKGLEAAAGIAAGGGIAVGAALVLKYLGDSALLEACEGTGCGEPGEPENDDDDDDDDEDESSTTSSSSTSSCSSTTLHNITSYCESYTKTTSSKQVSVTTVATTCPSSTTEITTTCETASRTRSSTITTTVWQQCSNTTVADMTKFCSTSSARPTFTTCTDSTTSNRTGCYITPTTTSIVANETCVAGTNQLGFQDPQGEFGEMIPMLSQSCPYFPDAPVSINDDQGQDGLQNATCSAPSGPYPTPLPSMDDDQGSDDGGVCPIDPIPDQPMDGALEGNLTESCSIPTDGTDPINPFDADQGSDGSGTASCVAPPANATGILWSPDADQGDGAPDSCQSLNGTGKISPQDDQGSDTVDAPSCPANKTDYPDPNDDQGQDGTFQTCPMPVYTIYQLPDDDNVTSSSMKTTHTPFSQSTIPGETTGPMSPKLPLIPTITPPPATVVECPIPKITNSGFGSCIAHRNNDDPLTCNCTNTQQPGKFVTVPYETMCGNLVCPNNYDQTITAPGPCTIPQNDAMGPCALVATGKKWGTLATFCECYKSDFAYGKTSTDTFVPTTICNSAVCTNQVKHAWTVLGSGEHKGQTFGATAYPTGNGCTPSIDPELRSCSPYITTYAPSDLAVGIATLCACEQLARTGRSLWTSVTTHAYELCNRHVCPGEPYSMVTDPAREVYLPAGCTETWDSITTMGQCQITYAGNQKTNEPSCACGPTSHDPVWPKTVCGSMICPNPQGMDGVATTQNCSDPTPYSTHIDDFGHCRITSVGNGRMSCDCFDFNKIHPTVFPGKMCNTMVCPNPEDAVGTSVLGNLTIDSGCSDALPTDTAYGRCTIVAESGPASNTAAPFLDKKDFSCRCRDQPSGVEVRPTTLCGSTAVCPNPYDWWGASIISTPVYVSATTTSTHRSPSTPASAGASTTAPTPTLPSGWTMASRLSILPTAPPVPARTTDCPYPIVPGLTGCTAYVNEGTIRCSCSASDARNLTSVRPSNVCGNLMCPNVAMTAQKIPGDCTAPTALLNGGIGSCELVMEMTKPPYCDCLGDRQATLSSPTMLCGEMMCPNLIKTISRPAKGQDMVDIYYTGDSCSAPTDPWIKDCELMQITSAVPGSSTLVGTSYCDCTHNNPTRNQPKATRITPLTICNQLACPNQINKTPNPYDEITFPADCTRGVWTANNVGYCRTTSGPGVLEPSCTCDNQGYRTVWPYPVCNMLMCPNPSGTAGVAPISTPCNDPFPFPTRIADYGGCNIVENPDRNPEYSCSCFRQKSTQTVWPQRWCTNYVCPNPEGPEAATPIMPKGNLCFGRTFISRPDVGRCTITSDVDTVTATDGSVQTAYSCFCRNQGDATIRPWTMCDVLACPNPAGWYGAISMAPWEMSSYISANRPWPAHGKMKQLVEASTTAQQTAPASADATPTSYSSVDTGLIELGPGETAVDEDFWSLLASIEPNSTWSTSSSTAGSTLADDAPPNPMGATDAMDAVVHQSANVKFEDKAKATGAEKEEVSTSTGDQIFGPGFTGAWPTAQEERVWWWSENATLPAATAAPNGTNETATGNAEQISTIAANVTAQASAEISPNTAAQAQNTTSSAKTASASGAKLDKGDESGLSALLSKLTTKNKARSATSASTTGDVSTSLEGERRESKAFQ